MNRLERAKVRADFLEALAVEMESHMENGSGFIFETNGGREDAPEDVVKIRTQGEAGTGEGEALRGAVRVVRTMARRARRVRL